MVSVQLRNAGQGLWTALLLPTSVQAAQTLASAARALNLADQVRETIQHTLYKLLVQRRSVFF